MKCPCLNELPPPRGKIGWPWTVETPSSIFKKYSQGLPWPKVSLVTPSFNQGRYLEETIRSVLLQGYPDLEYFIIDGGSTDESISIIKKYERWLAGWVSEPDRGQSHAINKGLAMCTGKYFNWNNSDDVLNKNSLRECVFALEGNRGAGGVTGYILTIDEQSNILSCNDDHPILAGKSGFLHDVPRCISLLKGGCQPGGLMEVDLARRVGGVDEGIHYAMDSDLQLRMMLHKPFYHIDFPVIRFRMHTASKTSSYVGERAVERIKIAKKIFSGDTLLSPEIKELKLAALSTAYRHAYNFYKVQGKFMRALWYQAISFTYSIVYHLTHRSLT